jgi:ribosomal protein S18 acetylase RimI-like enzyme
VSRAAIERLSQSQIDELLPEIVEVYSAALGRDPVESMARFQTEVLPRHREREAFRFLVARAGGEIVGIAYGYVGARGQWWTERVAEAMTSEEQARWLDPRHFEVVELHVLPSHQRQGIGRSLLSALLDGLDVSFVLLSTDEGNTRARTFYRSLGWTENVSGVDFASAAGRFVILSRSLG